MAHWTKMIRTQGFTSAQLMYTGLGGVPRPYRELLEEERQADLEIESLREARVNGLEGLDELIEKAEKRSTGLYHEKFHRAVFERLYRGNIEKLIAEHWDAHRPQNRVLP